MPSRKVRKLASMLRRKPNFSKRSASGVRRAKAFIRRPRFTTLRSRFSKGRVASRWGRLRNKFGLKGKKASLTITKNHAPYTVLHYKTVGKKPYKINASFQAKVAESMGHRIRYTDIVNGWLACPSAACAWQQITVGDQTDYDNMYDWAQKNAVGWKEADWNTAGDSAQQYKMHIKIIKNHQHYDFINNSESIQNVEFYEMEPRHDLHTTTLLSSVAPINLLLSQSQDGDLLADAGSAMLTDDPRFTPFMVPTLTAHWKINNVRKIKVHPGGVFTADCSVNNVMDIPIINSALGQTVYFKGKTKVILIKVYGELGCVLDGGINYIRHLPTTLVWKNNITNEFNISRDTRFIYNDRNLSRSGGSFSGTPSLINQETGDKVTYQEVLPSNDT